MLKQFILLTAFVFISLNACVTPVDFTTPTSDSPNLVVDGRLTQLHEKHQLNLYGATGINQVVGSFNDAKITLFEDGDSIAHYTYNAILNGNGGFEINDTSFIAKIGRQYSLKIEMPRTNKVYISSPQMMQPPIAPDSVVVLLGTQSFTNENDVTLNRNVWQVVVGSALPNKSQGEYFLRIAGQDAYTVYGGKGCLSQNVCYIVEDTDPTRINLLSSHTTQSNRYDGLYIGGRDVSALELQGRQLFGVVQYRISAEVYDFWSRLKSVAYPNGTILDGTPASVKGNMIDVVTKEHTLGVFEVASVGSKYTILTHGDLPAGYDYDVCAQSNGNFCCGCQYWKGSLSNPPTFWR